MLLEDYSENLIWCPDFWCHLVSGIRMVVTWNNNKEANLKTKIAFIIICYYRCIWSCFWLVFLLLVFVFTHFLSWMMVGPFSSYSCFVAHIWWKEGDEARIDPPVQTARFCLDSVLLSDLVLLNLIFIVGGARWLSSSRKRSLNPVNIVLPPDRTILAYKSLTMVELHLEMHSWVIL